MTVADLPWMLGMETFTAQHDMGQAEHTGGGLALSPDLQSSPRCNLGQCPHE